MSTSEAPSQRKSNVPDGGKQTKGDPRYVRVVLLIPAAAFADIEEASKHYHCNTVGDWFINELSAGLGGENEDSGWNGLLMDRAVRRTMAGKGKPVKPPPSLDGLKVVIE